METVPSTQSDDWIQEMIEDIDKAFKNDPDLKIYKTGTY